MAAADDERLHDGVWMALTVSGMSHFPSDDVTCWKRVPGTVFQLIKNFFIDHTVLLILCIGEDQLLLVIITASNDIYQITNQVVTPLSFSSGSCKTQASG